MAALEDGAKSSSWALASEGPRGWGEGHLLAPAPASCLPAACTPERELL